jgi:hypothetical protein
MNNDDTTTFHEVCNNCGHEDTLVLYGYSDEDWERLVNFDKQWCKTYEVSKEGNPYPVTLCRQCW